MSEKINSQPQGDERTRLLPKPQVNPNDQKLDVKTEKQQYLEFAVYSLEGMLFIFMLSLIFTTILSIVRETNGYKLPLWLIFLPVWLGHAIIFGISLRVLQLTFRSLIPGFEKDKLTNKVLKTNEKRVALAQYSLYNLLWLHGISSMAILFEVLLYLGLMEIIPLYACLIPIYIVSSIAIINTLICRTTPFSSGLSWICIFVFSILCNLKVNGATNLPWVVIVIPIVLLLAFWLSIFLYIFFMYSLSIFVLKKYQIESILLYFLSSLGTILSISFFINSDTVSDSKAKNEWIVIGTSLLLVCEVLFTLAIIKCADASIALTIDRMGSDRPQSLIRSEQGWDIDPTHSFENYPFIGEIESTRPQMKEINDGDISLPFCGCCSSITVMDLLSGGGGGGGSSSNSNSKNPTPTPSRSASRGDLESFS